MCGQRIIRRPSLARTLSSLFSNNIIFCRSYNNNQNSAMLIRNVGGGTGVRGASVE